MNLNSNFTYLWSSKDIDLVLMLHSALHISFFIEDLNDPEV